MKKHHERSMLFEDFLACVFLANTQFHGAKYVFPSLRCIWYDEKLRRAISMLERFYATSLAFLLGTIVICAKGMHAGVPDGMILWMLLIWVLADCLLISPLIYYTAVPKPVRQHMKEADKLNPHEKQMWEEEMSYNDRLEKIMKKYKNSGRNFEK